ncbi:MAG: YARHG domain-containing protein [Devosia sp.]|nr:YARHG domain-containing protein [Devosia sp.]
MRKLAIALGIALLTSGSAMAACYEEIGCTDEDRFRKSDLRYFSCQILWDIRNTIYKENGYCFQTERAIDYFGNEGCWITKQGRVRMSTIERQNVDTIVAVERQKGCN